MAANPMPPLEVMNNLFEADPRRGLLIHKQGKNKGLVAGWSTNNGAYRAVHVRGYGAYPVHRVLYCLYHQELLLPEDLVDHKDRITTNNKEKNLRKATHTQNALNKKKPTNCTSGTVGVIFCKRARAWIARITVNGERLYLGRSKDFDIAVAFRKRAERKYGFSHNYGDDV